MDLCVTVLIDAQGLNVTTFVRTFVMNTSSCNASWEVTVTPAVSYPVGECDECGVQQLRDSGQEELPALR